MITKAIWNELDFKLGWKCKGDYYYDDSYITWFLLITVIFTPIAFIFDLLFLPIEIVYLICYKTIEKKRYY